MFVITFSVENGTKQETIIHHLITCTHITFPRLLKCFLVFSKPSQRKACPYRPQYCDRRFLQSYLPGRKDGSRKQFHHLSINGSKKKYIHFNSYTIKKIATVNFNSKIYIKKVQADRCKGGFLVQILIC